MLWCSVSLQCFCDGDGACGGELLADSHMELIERNRGITSWCPDAWSSCASTEVGCQSQERTEDCGLCRAKAACSWCLYSDAVDATASMCIFNGDSGGQTRSCLDIRTVCPVVEVARTENLDSVISVAAILGACFLGSVFGTIWKEKKRRRDRRAVREAALVRAEGGGQDAHGANIMIKAQVEDRKQQLQIALSLLPSFEFGKLSLPPGGTPLDELPSFEQRQLDLSTGGVMAGSVDDKIISRSESLPLERADSKLGAVGKLRAKSLKVAEALSIVASRPGRSSPQVSTSSCCAPSASPATTTTARALCCRAATSSTASASSSGCSRAGRRAATVPCARSPSCKAHCKRRWTRHWAGMS